MINSGGNPTILEIEVTCSQETGYRIDPKSYMEVEDISTNGRQRQLLYRPSSAFRGDRYGVLRHNTGYGGYNDCDHLWHEQGGSSENCVGYPILKATEEPDENPVPLCLCGEGAYLCRGFLKYSFVIFTTVPLSSRSAIRFGMAIIPLSVSEMSHISLPLPVAPTTQTKMKMTL